jgi:hypothetical protein
MITLDILASIELKRLLDNTFGGQKCEATSQILCLAVILARKTSEKRKSLDTSQKRKQKPNLGIRCVLIS